MIVTRLHNGVIGDNLENAVVGFVGSRQAVINLSRGVRAYGKWPKPNEMQGTSGNDSYNNEYFAVKGKKQENRKEKNHWG